MWGDKAVASGETKRWTLGVSRTSDLQAERTPLEPGFDASSSSSTTAPHTPPPLATYTRQPAPHSRSTQPPTHLRWCELCMRLLEVLRGGDGGLVRVFLRLEVVEENNGNGEGRGEARRGRG